MKTNHIILGIFLLALSANLFSQIDNFSYRQEISGIEDTWHNINLNPDIFHFIQPNMNDLRVIGFTVENDTVEAPYIITRYSTETFSNDVAFKIINKTKKDGRSFATFKTLKSAPVNRINLDISGSNFNIKVRLEGSQDQEQWFEILDNYRMVDIHNNFVEYNFSNLYFQAAQYKYYRVSWSSQPGISLKSASLKMNRTEKGLPEKYTSSYKITEDKEANKTIVDIKLEKAVPVSRVIVKVDNGFDFYRPISFQKVRDSIEVNGKWKKAYSDIDSDMLSSLEEPLYSIPETFTNNLRVLITNHDNEPLKITGVEVEGDKYSLTTRFTEPANYYLYYGNRSAQRPNYDIKYFKKKIPKALQSVELIHKEVLFEEEPTVKKPEAKKAWLWAIMGAIVVVLGGFTIHLIRNSTHE